MLQRRTTWAALAGVVVIGVIATIFFSTREKSRDGQVAPGENAASALEGGPDELLILSGNSLQIKGIEDQSEEMVAEVPTRNIYPSPGSTWIAYVTSEVSDGGTVPSIHLLDVETEEERNLGAGYAPVWSPGGTQLSYLKPLDQGSCGGEVCSGEAELVVRDLISDVSTTVLEEGAWSVISWAGDRVLVADGTLPDETLSVGLEDDPIPLELNPASIWGVSPDGTWLVQVDDEGQRFVPLEEGRLGGEPVEIELKGTVLGEGSWSHDSSMVAVITYAPTFDEVRGEKKGSKNKTKEPASTAPLGLGSEVVTLSPDQPAPEPVAESLGAQAEVLWSPDGRAIVFPKLPSADASVLQAVYCTLDGRDSCRIVSSWSGGVDLLRLQ